MRRFLGICLMITLIVGLVGCTTLKSGKPSPEPAALKPVLVLATPTVTMSKNAQVMIMGTGFQPGQEINLLFTSADGITSDIAYALKPELKVDKTGTWSTSWSCGRFISKKLITGGVYKLTVVDGNYTPLAQASIYFVK